MDFGYVCTVTLTFEKMTLGQGSALELHSPVTRREQLPALGELNSHGHSPVLES